MNILSNVKTTQIDLSFRGPMNWKHMLKFYNLRAIENLETVKEQSYQRYFELNGQRGWFSASNPKSNVLRIELRLSDRTQLRDLTNQLRRMFDLDRDITMIEQQLTELEPNLVKHSGIRIPGVWNTWEAGVRAILGQQISLKAAVGQLNILVHTLQPSGVTHFPTPEEVSKSDLSFLRMPISRKDTLKRFADYMMIYPNHSPCNWLAIKGIGPWTVHYALLRGVSEPNCFLSGDLVVKKALANFPNLSADSASPWGSYATFHCWNQI